jgi:hypothetical protein
MLRRHFEPYGELEYVRVIPGKNCGFVRYCFRASAEFAKAAMNDGYLDQGNEVIEVKWAHEDPNPLARQHEQRQRQLEFINAVQVQDSGHARRAAREEAQHSHAPGTPARSVSRHRRRI